jgi:hypothetical protein
MLIHLEKKIYVCKFIKSDHFKLYYFFFVENKIKKVKVVFNIYLKRS